ncbi:MAG: hypothetical protein GY805_24520 [Chloroflexi bacterium]|nr:hypothetical protein [Chloroflexota bacterium]
MVKETAVVETAVFFIPLHFTAFNSCLRNNPLQQDVSLTVTLPTYTIYTAYCSAY